MTRRVALLAASLVSMAAMATVSPVAASVVEPEPVATYLPVQTTGVGLAAPNESVPWGLDRLDQRGPIDADPSKRAYDHATTGAGVKVYVVDSGVQASHTDFGGRVQNGWGYRRDSNALANYQSFLTTQSPTDCNLDYSIEGRAGTYRRAFDPDTYDPLADPSDFGTVDNDGHGTHVAGIVAGTVAGVAKGATIVPVRVLDSCGRGTQTMIEKGLQWVLNQHTPGQKAIMNLSLGFGQQVPAVDSLIQSLIDEGMVVVAAAGNDAVTSCGTTPAGTLGTFSVGSMQSQLSNGAYIDRESSFSNHGQCVDIFAPGGSIASTWSYLREDVSGASVVPNAFVLNTGTSMAAPHVAGVLARYLETQTLTSSANANVSVNAWQWLRTQATCNAVQYWDSSRPVQTANRLLAVGAPVAAPCPVTNASFTISGSTATVTWDEPVAFNGEAPTYEATLEPGGFRCTTTGTSCAITGVPAGASYQLAVVARNSATPVTLASTSVTAGDRMVRVSWSGRSADGATYTVTASPGGATCTTTSTTCDVTGLVNNQPYTVTVSATNGLTSISESVSATPNGAPSVPASIRTSVGLGRATFRWSAITDSASPTYVLSTRDGAHWCRTTATSCTIRGLPNGKALTFRLRTSTTTGGESTASTSVKVWAGFTVRSTSVARGTRTRLTSIVTPASTGRVTWATSSPCRISASRLVAPGRATSCVLTVRTAQRGSTPATSMRLRVTIR